MEKVRAAATVTWTELVEFATEAYVGCGAPPADARKAAAGIVDADLHGTVTHGLKNLRNYVQNILDGKINPKPNMRDIGGGLSARVITADNGLGHVAGHIGMERAIELATASPWSRRTMCSRRSIEEASPAEVKSCPSST